MAPHRRSPASHVNFHRLGAAALVVTLGVGGLLLWLAASDSQDAQAQHLWRLGVRAWLVAAAVFWAWYLREEARRANPTHFSDSLPFVEHLQLIAGFEGAAADAAASLLGGGRSATGVVAVGSGGYNARLRRIEGAADGRLRLAVQLLKPATALPFLPMGAATKVLIDGGPVGTGEVVPPLAPANRR